MLLRLLSNVLCVLQGQLHLIENKIYEEIVINIPIDTSGNWGISEVARKWTRCFGSPYLAIRSSLCGKGHHLSRMFQEETLISILLKKQN